MSITDVDTADFAIIEPSDAPADRFGRVRQAATVLRDRARRYAGAAQEQARTAGARTLETVRARPVTTAGSAVGVSLALGAVLGFLVGRAMSARA